MPAKTTTKPAAKPTSKTPAAPAPEAKSVSTKIGVVDSDAREKTRKVVLTP